MSEIVSREQLFVASFTAFAGFQRIASGTLVEVAEVVKAYVDTHPESSVLIFHNSDSQVVDIDFRGSVYDVIARVKRRDSQDEATVQLIESLKQEPQGAGRPRLGVVAREVTLLPRHWDWLNRQPGGASVALRRLVEDARRLNNGKDRERESQETTYRFMSAIAGDLPGFEEALRALFAGNAGLFRAITTDWPVDVREHSLKLAADAF
jgi:hypothetical protein